MPEHVYDKGYKRVLSRRRNFLHFLQKYIRLGWIDHVGEDDIELIDKSFIDDDFRERENGQNGQSRSESLGLCHSEKAESPYCVLSLGA